MEWHEVLIRLSIAAGLCGLIGVERELRGHPAGLRTHAVVGMGAALFTIAGAYGLGDLKPEADPTRVAAQIASGVGFLGAGVILRHGLDVRGLTTAATLWLAAAVGLAAGAGMGVAALITTGLVVLILLSARFTRELVERRTQRIIRVNYRAGSGALGQVIQAVEERARRLGTVRVTDREDTDPPERSVWMVADVTHDQVDALIVYLRSREGVVDVSIERADVVPED